MKKFDLKKAILENKATFHSSLTEGYDEFKRVEKGSKDVTAKDKGEEEVYGAGVEKGEEIEKKKMKMSELKAKIKEMVLAEMTLDVDTMEDAPESEVDFLAELEEMLNENSPMNDPRVEQIISMLKDLDVDGETMEYILRQVGMEDQMANQLVNNPAEYAASLGEAKGDEEVTDDVTADDVTVDDTETIDTETTTEVDPNVKAVQDALTQAQAAAQQLGDKKLTDQIGNTITFFTRTHVVEKPKGGAVAEAIINDSDIVQIKNNEDLKKVGGKLIFKFDAEVKANDFDDGREYKVYILADDEETAKDIGMKKVRSAFLPKNLNSGFPQSTDKANNLWTGKESNSEWYGIKKAESMTEAMFPFLKLRLK